MDETKLREQLDRLAGDAGLPDPTGRSTLARARRRRLVNAGATSLVVIALVAAGFTGIRSVLDRPVTFGDDPRPTFPPVVQTPSFPSLWPETTAEALAEAQAQVDAGHQPLRLDPAQTAAMLATNLFGWSYEETEANITEDGPITVVELRNRSFGVDIPPIRAEVTQLGRTGPDGIWSVLAVTSPLIQGVAVDIPPESAPSTVSTRTIHFQGRLTGLLEGVDVRVDVSHTAQGDPDTQPIWGGSPAGRLFEGSWEGSTDLDTTVLWFHVVDEPNSTVTLGATAIALGHLPVVEPAPGTGSPAPDIHLEGAPPDVAVTAQLVLDGVRVHDVDALAELIDPNTFVYNFDDGSDPTPAWREDPSVLDAIPGILRLPFVVQEIDGYGTFYVWPYLMKEGALEVITEQERRDLHSLGISDAEIEQMRDFGGYIGPRLAIDTNGVWRNYVVGGD